GIVPSYRPSSKARWGGQWCGQEPWFPGAGCRVHLGSLGCAGWRDHPVGGGAPGEAVVEPSEPVRWKKWTDPEVEGCWIAVCFFSDAGEPWVVAKRKGGF